MGGLKRFADSSVGAKFVVALSGLGLFGFIIEHMLGNMLVYVGPDALNAYAFALKSRPYLLWPARIGLIVIFVVHVTFTMRLALRNRASRPIKYQFSSDVQLTRASKSMVWTGLLIFTFLVYHLAHYTFRFIADTGERFDALGRPDVYYMVIRGFQNPVITGLYILAMLMLGTHLSHGVQSLPQTFGLNHPRYNRLLRMSGPIVGWGIALGNISMPLLVFLGVVRLPGGGL